MVFRVLGSGCWSVKVMIYNRRESRVGRVRHSDKGCWTLVCDLKN